jgi:hypothetical protein
MTAIDHSEYRQKRMAGSNGDGKLTLPARRHKCLHRLRPFMSFHPKQLTLVVDILSRAPDHNDKGNWGKNDTYGHKRTQAEKAIP